MERVIGKSNICSDSLGFTAANGATPGEPNAGLKGSLEEGCSITVECDLALCRLGLN
jgi:hypothetical protein